MGKQKIYQPQYYKKFHCIADECKENCCSHAWLIVVDKDTYDKYAGLEEEGREAILKWISVTNQDPFAAQLILGEKSCCQFLDERGRCNIQLKYGHGFLCHTCRSYPRRFCYVAGETETFLELSCEAVAKLVLFDQNIMRFETIERESDERMIWNGILRPEMYTSAENAVEIFWKLRTASIFIVQSRRYRLSVRMLILGMLIKQASDILAEEKYPEVVQLAKTFIDRVESNYFDSLVGQKPAGGDLDVGFVNKMLKDLELKEYKLLNRCISLAREGLGVKPDEDPPDGFDEEYQKDYETYFSDKEYVLENYIVSHIFSDGFPFNYIHQESIMKNYRELLVKYSLVKFLLVGISKRYFKYDKRKVVECVSSFSRAYDHVRGGALILK